jgi:drug/metabolite transporter (DMT)-like permease
MTSQKIPALLALIAGCVMVSGIGVLYKISSFELSISATIFNRLWIATIGLGLWKIIKHILSSKAVQVPTPSIPFKQQLMSFLAAPVSLVIYQLLWIYSIQETSVAISTVLHYLMPIYTAILAWIFFGKRFTRSYWISLVIVIAGILLLGVKDLNIAFKYIRADIAALLSGLFHAVYLIFSEDLTQYLSVLTILFRICITGSLCSLIILIIRHENIFPHSVRG